jgi:hypothetical protein
VDPETCRIIDLPKISDARGNLTFAEEGIVPFEIKRVFYLYDVPGGSSRGGHALKKCQQVLVAMAGGFDVVVGCSKNRQRIHLDRPWFGLYLPARIWREMENFSPGSICLALASEKYSETDYYRDYQEYVRALSISQ